LAPFSPCLCRHFAARYVNERKDGEPGPEPRYSGRLAIRGQEAGMSAKNGDKSRHQINRKRALIRRAKIRDLVKNAKAAAATAEKAEAK
jgi:hypothetical protein